jgi:hypothetical protein
MAFTLVLNSSNVVPGSSNSSFKYNFLGGNFQAKDMEICVGSLTMPYSFFNISTKYNNNTFSIFFPTTAGQIGVPVVLPNGFYTTNDLQQYIQQVCIANGFYLIDPAGNFVFYTFLTYSPTYYAVQLVQTLVPSSLPAGGWSTPANFQGFPPISYTPSLFLPATGSIAPIIGFAPNTYYPPLSTTANYNVLSTTTPVGSTVNSLVIRNTLVNNNVTTPSDIMDGFAINSTFASNIVYDPTFEKFVTLKDGVYNSMILTIVDQNLNSIDAQDPNVAITLIIRKIKN